MRPVFVPLRDGKVMEMQILDGKEVFRALDGTLPPSVANPFGKSIAVREKGTFHSNLGWTEAVKVNRGAGTDIDIDLETSAYSPPGNISREKNQQGPRSHRASSGNSVAATTSFTSPPQGKV